MKLKLVMKAIAVYVDAVGEDLPLVKVHYEIAKELYKLLDEEDKHLLQQCMCADGADLIFGV